jgi:hypothetical protein
MGKLVNVGKGCRFSPPYAFDCRLFVCTSFLLVDIVD